MRVNVYAEELTDRVEVIAKEVEGSILHGLRFYLELPVTVGEPGVEERGPFLHRAGDDDSAAVTFWGSLDEIRDLINHATSAVCSQ